MKEEKIQTLQVRDLQEDVYIKLTLVANEENRSGVSYCSCTVYFGNIIK